MRLRTSSCGPAGPAARAPRGLTLIEVLIAVTITAILGAMTLGTFQQLDRAGAVTREQGERFSGARLAMTRMARELSMAFVSEHYDQNRLRERPTAFVGREEGVLFCTFAHERLLADARESDEAAVQYTLETDPESKEGEQALFRRVKNRIDEDIDREGRKDVVARHVKSFHVRYFDPKRKEWVREWSTRSTDHASELPARVRIELEVALDDRRTEKLFTEARVALTRPLDF